jgi:hypothetical protein
MQKFTITIEEMITETFEVLAIDDEHAIEIAIEKYNNGEFVLAPGTLVAKQMSVESDGNIPIDWFEF